MAQPIFFDIRPTTLGILAEATGARLLQPEAAGLVVRQVAPVEDAPQGSLSFIDNPRYVRHAAGTGAAALFVSEKHAGRMPSHIALLLHEQPYRAYARALSLLFPGAGRPEPVTGETGVSAHARLSPDASVEDGAIIECGAVVGPGAAIGRDARVLANAIVGPGVQIGRDSTIGVGASVLNAFVGDRVIIHPGVRIGQDGFGFAMGAGGHVKVAQIGRVIIQDDVEIGANTTIDRGSLRDTVIGEGTKIDNLVQIGHNVSIGRHCVIIGMVGIAGSATLEDYVVVAGQAGIAGHIRIGAGAQIGGGAGVHQDVKPGERLIGYPAMDVKGWMRLNMMLKSMLARKSGSGDEA